MTGMSVSLSKKDKVNLSKINTGLRAIALGLGWDPAKGKSFFGLGGSKKDVDLDASCVMLDERGNVVDTVWFRQKVSRDGSIRHSGDNRTGHGAAGDKETILVDLKALPSNVKTLAFTVNSFTGQNFNEIENAYCKVYDNSTGTQKELGHFVLAEKGSHTGIFIASVTKENGEWDFTAQGKACPGLMIGEMMPTILRELALA